MKGRKFQRKKELHLPERHFINIGNSLEEKFKEKAQKSTHTLPFLLSDYREFETLRA